MKPTRLAITDPNALIVMLKYLVLFGLVCWLIVSFPIDFIMRSKERCSASILQPAHSKRNVCLVSSLSQPSVKTNRLDEQQTRSYDVCSRLQNDRRSHEPAASDLLTAVSKLTN